MINNTIRDCSKKEQPYRKCQLYPPGHAKAILVPKDNKGLPNEHNRLTEPKMHPKPNLSYLKLHKTSFPNTGKRTPYKECKDSNKDTVFTSETSISNTDHQKVDIDSQLYKIPSELSDMRKTSDEKSMGSYVEMFGKEKNSYELENSFDFTQYSSNQKNSNNPGNCQYSKDTNLHSLPHYFEIQDCQVANCIFPIQDFDNQMVRSVSLEGIDTDTLSDMLYHPPQGILDKKENFGKPNPPTMVDPTLASNNIKCEYSVSSGVKKNEKKLTKIFKKTLKYKKPEMKKQTKMQGKSAPNLVPPKYDAIFEDFSNNSELAKLGEKIRQQLEKQKL